MCWGQEASSFARQHATLTMGVSRIWPSWVLAGMAILGRQGNSEGEGCRRTGAAIVGHGVAFGGRPNGGVPVGLGGEFGSGAVG